MSDPGSMSYAQPSGYTSEDLFHLVGRNHPEDHEQNYQILLRILRVGRLSFPPHTARPDGIRITTRWNGSLVNEDLIVPEVICFCDIPYPLLKLHTRKYGQFGLSFNRNWLIYYGARPVMYIPCLPGDKSSTIGKGLLRDIEQTYLGFKDLVEKNLKGVPDTHFYGSYPNTPEEASSRTSDVFLKDFLAFIKPFDATLKDDDVNNYYLEREWRKFLHLDFVPEQVSKVVVPENYRERIKRELPSYSDKVKVTPAG